MVARTVRITALGIASLALVACSPQSGVSEAQTPDIQKRALAQLSAGGGTAGYDFAIDGTRVGTLLITDGSFGATGNCEVAGNYCDQQEYWRWDQAALDGIAAGNVTDVDVIYVGDVTSWSEAAQPGGLVDNFEDGTTNWTAWRVGRLFNLDATKTYTSNNATTNRWVYEMLAPWENGETPITYYVELDFPAASGYFPAMTWYVKWSDYQRWKGEVDADGDGSADDGVWAVQLTEDSDWSRITSGINGAVLEEIEVKMVK